MTATNHSKFQNHLKESHAAVLRVAEYLTQNGRDVIIGGLHVAPTAGDWQQYADGGCDIQICHGVNVKKLSADFTCESDWPFKDYIVCAKHAYDDAIVRPKYYMALNRAGTHIGAVESSSQPQWRTEARTDKRYHELKQEFYVCNLDCVKWQDIR